MIDEADDGDWWSDLTPEVIYVSEETWEWLQKELERPARPSPRLVELLKRRTRLDDQ